MASPGRGRLTLPQFTRSLTVAPHPLAESHLSLQACATASPGLSWSARGSPRGPGRVLLLGRVSPALTGCGPAPTAVSGGNKDPV